MSEESAVETVTTEPQDGRQPKRVAPQHILIEFLPGNQTGLSINLEGVQPVAALGWLAVAQDQVLMVQKQFLAQQLVQQASQSVQLANSLQPLPPLSGRRR